MLERGELNHVVVQITKQYDLKVVLDLVWALKLHEAHDKIVDVLIL